MSSETLALIAIAITVVGNLYVIGEKLFGGGNKLAAKFGTLELKHAQDMAKMREDFFTRCETSDSNTRMGIATISANVNLLEKGLLQFHVKLAEDYMRRDSYYKAADEIKANFKDLNNATRQEMHDGFERVEKTLGELAQAVEAGRKQRNHT